MIACLISFWLVPSISFYVILGTHFFEGGVVFCLVDVWEYSMWSRGPFVYQPRSIYSKAFGEFSFADIFWGSALVVLVFIASRYWNIVFSDWLDLCTTSSPFPSPWSRLLCSSFSVFALLFRVLLKNALNRPDLAFRGWDQQESRIWVEFSQICFKSFWIFPVSFPLRILAGFCCNAFSPLLIFLGSFSVSLESVSVFSKYVPCCKVDPPVRPRCGHYLW